MSITEVQKNDYTFLHQKAFVNTDIFENRNKEKYLLIIKSFK